MYYRTVKYLFRSNAGAFAHRNSTVPIPWTRFQSSKSTGHLSNFAASHMAAGIAGGCTVILAGYVWYHTSDLKTIVQKSLAVKTRLQSAKDIVSKSATDAAKHPSQALNHLRDVAKSYASLIPGLSDYIDKAFDEIDAAYSRHSEDMDKIVQETMRELKRVANEGDADANMALEMFGILTRDIKRMQELGNAAGNDFIAANPVIKEKIGDMYQQLKKLADTAGPEAKKKFDDATKQIREDLREVNDESINTAYQLLQTKTAEIKKMVEPSMDGIIQGGNDKLKALISRVPGGDEALKNAPHLKEILALASDRSKEATKLAEETVRDVLQVLEEKGKKAKELADRAKDESTKRANS